MENLVNYLILGLTLMVNSDFFPVGDVPE